MTIGICIRNASLTHRDREVFTHLDLRIPASKWVALLGPDTIGKSALLRMIAGASHPEENAFYQITTDNNLPIKEQVTLITHDDQLRPWLTVYDNILVSLQVNQLSAEEASDKHNTAKSLLDDLNMASRIHLYPHQLTQDLRQRVALIRAVVDDKPIVLIDDPFGHLEAIERIKLLEMMARLFTNKTVMFITREPTEALRFANEIIVMHDQPARLTSVASFSSPIPREIPDPQLSAIYTALFSQLSTVNI